jgi:uncharacterized protein
MFFHITELEHHPVAFELTFAPGEIALGEELRQTGPLHAAGQAELLKNTLGEIRLQGRVRVALETGCDRCLEPAAFAIDNGFDLFFRPAPRIEGHSEKRIEAGEEELAFYEGDGLELENALREYILLELPMQHTCRPECKGICPQCGENRNVRECGCAARLADDRLAALKNLD